MRRLWLTTVRGVNAPRPDACAAGGRGDPCTQCKKKKIAKSRGRAFALRLPGEKKEHTFDVAKKVAGAERLVGPARRIRAGVGHGTFFQRSRVSPKTQTRYARKYIPLRAICK